MCKTCVGSTLCCQVHFERSDSWQVNVVECMQAATPAGAKVQYYSNETYLPAVTSVANLSNYMTVDAFGDNDRQRVSGLQYRPTHAQAFATELPTVTMHAL